MRVPAEEFDTLVERAIDSLPPQFAELLDNVVVMVEEEPSDEDLESVGIDPASGDELLGLYQGTPLSERDTYYSALPDRVLIFRGPILRRSASRREVVREVRDTVIHELGHHFGLGEEDMPF